MALRITDFDKGPSLLQQALTEQKKQLESLPPGVTTAIIGKASTDHGGEARIGVVTRSQDGRFNLAGDLGWSKDHGFGAQGSFIFIPK